MDSLPIPGLYLGAVALLFFFLGAWFGRRDFLCRVEIAGHLVHKVLSGKVISYHVYNGLPEPELHYRRPDERQNYPN